LAGDRDAAIDTGAPTAIGHPNAQGVIVNTVEASSPAEKANLKQGDVITAYNGTSIQTPRDLALAVANSANGSEARLTVWSDGHESVVPVLIGEQRSKVALGTDETAGSPVGLALAPLDQDAREHLDLDPSVKGAVVTEVTPGSRADDSGVQSGDVIVRVGNQPVTTPAEASAKIRAAQREKKEALPLMVMRNGTTYFLALKLAKV